MNKARTNREQTVNDGWGWVGGGGAANRRRPDLGLDHIYTVTQKSKNCAVPYPPPLGRIINPS